MLVYILAIAIALGSLGFFLTAKLQPNLHKKDDFLWSGVGLFYALVLWDCAGRITGGVLLGQTASVLLLGWFGWQTILYRKALRFPEQQETILKFSLLDWLENKIKAKKSVILTPKKEIVKEETTTDKVETTIETEEKEVITETETREVQEEIIAPENTKKREEIKPVIEEKKEIKAEINEIKEEIEPEKIEAKIEVKTEKKGLFGKIFSKKTEKKEAKPETKVEVKKESITEEIWDEETTLINKEEQVEITEQKEDKVTVETEKIENEIQKKEIVESEITREKEVKIEEKEVKNEAKPEIKTEEKTGESEDDNPFKELTS